MDLNELDWNRTLREHHLSEVCLHLKPVTSGATR